MGFLLIDNPPARPQYRRPRREALSGGVGVHTAEGAMDDVGIDTGAENVGGFIRRRTDGPGSYHDVGDSDSVVELLPDDAEAFQMETGDNRHLLSYSFACRTIDLNPAQGWTQRAMRIAGQAIVKRWRRIGADPVASARWVTYEQAQRLRYAHERTPDGRLVGWLINHGTAQPYNRSDAWATSPFRAELAQMLVDSILIAAGAAPAPDQEDEVTTYRFITAHDGLHLIWGPDGETGNQICPITHPSEMSVYTALWGATPLGGDQTPLADRVYFMCDRTPPWAKASTPVVRLADVDRKKLVEELSFLAAGANDAPDQATRDAWADQVVERMFAELGDRLAA